MILQIKKKLLVEVFTRQEVSIIPFNGNIKVFSQSLILSSECGTDKVTAVRICNLMTAVSNPIPLKQTLSSELIPLFPPPPIFKRLGKNFGGQRQGIKTDSAMTANLYKNNHNRATYHKGPV